MRAEGGARVRALGTHAGGHSAPGRRGCCHTPGAVVQRNARGGKPQRAGAAYRVEGEEAGRYCHTRSSAAEGRGSGQSTATVSPPSVERRLEDA